MLLLQTMCIVPGAIAKVVHNMTIKTTNRQNKRSDIVHFLLSDQNDDEICKHQICTHGQKNIQQ